MVEMTTEMMNELEAVVEAVGADEVFQQIATIFRDKAEEIDETDEEAARKLRVRGNGVMQALRFYQAFIKERNAE